MKHILEIRSFLLAVILFGATAGPGIVAGCVPSGVQGPVSDQTQQLTHGQVQMRLAVGETTKADVLEHFGAPNVTTRTGDGRERWTYQRAAQVRESSARQGYWNILIAGQSGVTGGGASSSRMITLIIDFDENDVVVDFRSRTSNF